MQKIKELMNENLVESKVTTRGWVYRWRESGKILFIIVRDSTGIIQVTVSKDEVSDEDFKNAKSSNIESSVIVEGILRRDERAPGGYEILAKKFILVGPSLNFPITKDKSDEFLLDMRHLWLRSREMTAILKIRSTIFESLHEFFRNEGYYEVQAPMFVSSSVEGGSTLFEVPYFGRKAYLTQSSQFYLETFIFSLENVYTIAPSFRAEKSRTRRHLTEFWHCEAEAAWLGNDEMMKIEEKMIMYIIERVLNKNKEELKFLKRDISKLESLSLPFDRMEYADVIKLGKDVGLDIDYGSDLGADEEYAITQKFQKPTFIVHFPKEIKPFYHRPDPKNPNVVLNHDLLAPEGYGEIIGGGERIWELNILLERIKEERLNPDDYSWYIDLRKYGSVPHSGFGLGIDRLVWWIGGLEHIKYAVPYPRNVRRLLP
ncbi:MAG: asparagine--tRNA ligase [Thermoplasmata archaeon]